MTKEKLIAMQEQLDRLNPETDKLRYRAQEKRIDEAKQELAKSKTGVTFADLVEKHSG